MRDLPPLDAASYAAGEGSRTETLAFDARLDQDPSLRREVDFWRTLGPALTPAETPPAPDLSATILRRAILERRDPRPLRTPRWVWPSAVAATVLVSLGGWHLGRTSQDITPSVEIIDAPIAYTEDGSGILPPPAEVILASYLPLSGATAIETDRPRPLPDASRPWIGLWTRPAKLLVHGETQRDAHLVLRVVGGSPAWQAGIRPGDMLLSFNGCSLHTPICLAHALDDCKPGDTVPVVYWSGEQGATITAKVSVEVIHE